ncbi:MAG: sigma-70 family RNA polymerase sigma factor [Acidobacteriia bacterium]|nr:sigma-70 family RNA polymerase sigma factor [Terriglobia bacterium]
MAQPGDVTSLLAEIHRGNRRAESELIPLIYDELHRLAAYYMRRERSDHTLQATALVHEVYLRLSKQREVTWQNKAHFFAIAGSLMRRILVDHARAHSRSKRGGLQQKISLEEALLFSEEQSEELMLLDTALAQLTEEHPRQSQIVELRFFGGLTVEEIAEVLKVSPKTVKRDWSVARAWLYREIHKQEAG